MKINISDMMDHWEEEVPRLEEVFVPEPDLLQQRTLSKVRGIAPSSKRRRLAPALVIAAAALVCVVGVSAATGQFQAVLSLPWQNDVVVSSEEEAWADWSDTARSEAENGKETASFGLCSPNGDPPFSLEEMVESRRDKAMNWESLESARGSFGPSVEQWTEMEVTNANGPVKSRTVQGRSHMSLIPKKYVKYEYTARTPAELASVTSGLVVLDTDWMAKHYQVPEWANFYYQIYNSRNALSGEVYYALYTTPDGRYVDLSYAFAPGMNLSPSYRIESNYDRVENYTSATGIEAVIATKNGTLWADAESPEFILSFYGGYLTVEEAEAILDHITINTVPET